MLRLITLFAVICVSLIGCQTLGTFGGVQPPPNLANMETKTISVVLPDLVNAQLGAELWSPKKALSPKRVVVMVPGSGFVSRRGIQDSDGVLGYGKPIHVTQLWAMQMAQQGYYVLSYDKRVCTPSHDSVCNNNPTDDIDKQGPVAMAKDVDEACDAAQKKWGETASLILWSFDQGAQIALASECAKKAKAMVLVAPIPFAVDHFMVSGLKNYAQHAPSSSTQLLNRAESLNETFNSLKKGLFPEDAMVMGATISFWQKWIDLTEGTSNLLAKTPAKILFVLGQRDWLYGVAAQKSLEIQALANGRGLVRIHDANHHLLVDNEIKDASVTQLANALDKLLKPR